ncbi:hypothetical protein OE88DRAFT_1514406 [Heliocybe sulcata]|uniref:Uncharacterized protein n=1 Tax=Heliocybe sulcata TaxID=5364 RepID=A0A5C3N2D1_9AGAM|nr:hypothetical protein OE88DRAFT_1514406 [Heliocybe sulcata]
MYIRMYMPDECGICHLHRLQIWVVVACIRTDRVFRPTTSSNAPSLLHRIAFPINLLCPIFRLRHPRRLRRLPTSVLDSAIDARTIRTSLASCRGECIHNSACSSGGGAVSAVVENRKHSAQQNVSPLIDRPGFAVGPSIGKTCEVTSSSLAFSVNDVPRKSDNIMSLSSK